MNNYSDFIDRKLTRVPPTGIPHAGAVRLPDGLFDFQRVLVTWALRRGRAAIFADTGLGKTRMQLAWADAVHRETGHDVLILAPLAVAAQTATEGAEIGVEVRQCRDGSEVQPGITITNYDRLHRFDTSRFGAVVLDESSVIKHHTSKTLAMLLEAFEQTPFKLCATATPAPNDWTELGTHAEFLGICTQVEMLSEYFVHDGGDTQTWRLKGHAREHFWRWVASWSALVRKPSDLGFDDTRYNLPPLRVSQHTTETDAEPEAGMLFALEASTLSERRKARRDTMDARVDACAALVNAEWYKLAARESESDHDLEAGTCRGAQEAREVGPGVRSEAEGAVCKRSGSPKGIHARVLQVESGEVQADAGAARGEERGEASQVRSGCGNAHECQSAGQGVAEGEPGKAQESEVDECARDRAERLSGHARSPERRLRDMRALGSKQAALLPGGGSLSRPGEDSRASVHELQSGAREVSGQPGHSDAGSRVHREPWLIWCDLNAEQDALERHFGDLAFSVRGSMTPDEKETAILAWMAGERPVMISKPSIMGWGINAQHCARMAFVGVTDSWESYYQAVRRCWRFGQKREVEVHIFASDLEGAIVSNLQRKERDAKAMADSLSAETHDAVMEEVTGNVRQSNPYSPSRTAEIPAWLVTEEEEA